MSSILIKNGYILSLDSIGTKFYGDLLIQDKKIKQISPKIDVKSR